jgi:Glutaminase
MMRPTKESAVLTIAAVRRAKRGGAIECLFNEREQIFTLSAKSPASIADRLNEAYERNTPVKVVLNPRQASVQRIDSLSAREAAQFERTRVLLENPDKPQRVNLSSIDPTTFNVVGHYLDFPAFRLCNRIIPSYSAAKSIFDFCADQSCALPGPPAVSPCIPFQYVRDGCYARAHKMRWIIENEYGYCCEKVFSFANQGNDRLAVVASKWGGCCVTWWYHVAPLVRVRVRLRLGSFSIQFVLAMVIDPGMFDKPVLLSTWLMAQENTSCSPTANVSMYSIQPGSAYSPASYAGTSFTTDPTYAATDATLINYKNLTTCP